MQTHHACFACICSSVHVFITHVVHLTFLHAYFSYQCTTVLTTLAPFPGTGLSPYTCALMCHTCTRLATLCLAPLSPGTPPEGVSIAARGLTCLTSLTDLMLDGWLHSDESLQWVAQLTSVCVCGRVHCLLVLPSSYCQACHTPNHEASWAVMGYSSG